MFHGCIGSNCKMLIDIIDYLLEMKYEIDLLRNTFEKD